MITNAGFHGWRDVQRLMHAPEVVIHEVQRHGVRVVLDLLAETVGQPREAAHAHAHRQVGTLDIAG